MNTFFRLNRYITLISFSKYVIFNTIAEKCCTKGTNVKKNNVCCGSKNVEKVKSEGSSEEIKKSDDHYKNDDKDKQKELQKLKELEEKKKKEKLKDLIDNYKKRLVKINSEIKILKESIKEYFDKNKFDVSVTENEINNITDLDNEKVGEKLKNLENKELKGLKKDILEYLKNKFSVLKNKDKDNKLNINDKDITDLEKSENITPKDLITLYDNLNTFELILNGDINDSKIIRKLFSSFNKFEVPTSEEKYKQYEAELKKEYIQEGSFGKIYKIDENYVLKVIDKKADLYNDEDMKNEILISYIFDKVPNIVEMNDYFQYGDKIYLKLKYYKKGDLFGYIEGKFKIKDKDKIHYQLITALSKLHKRGIAHRDIKLENIFVDENYDVCLADFGKATIYDTNKKYALNLNEFSFPDEYVKLFRKSLAERKTFEGQMDLFKNDIFALGLVFLSLELKYQTPGDVLEKDFFTKRTKMIDKKDKFKNDDLKKLLNIMLSQDLNIGKNIDEILGSNYYKRLEGLYGGKS